ncbi:retrovirus-related pol polyprotein from transposon TNT 1-94 [Tanacetum coccineum]|uniref:Retrovirus-related pol polyprotein from transposon TNT 1-94 n=1 Tax=Tanacetum coccineum TaxID=301880 RepID=A0ABQ4XT76_9ASTR
MMYSEQTHLVNYPENKITSDSNIIPYSQYLLETQNAAVQDTNSFAQQDAMILSVFEQLSNQVTKCNKVNKDNLIANESLSAEFERYKERVKLLEERQNVDLSTREKLIMDDIIREKNAQFVDFEKEINYLKQTFSKQSKEKELLTKTFNVFKNESKEKEAKNINKEIALEKKVKELDNIVSLGFQNPFYLKKAQQIRAMLYDGIVIAKETNVISITNSEETLMLKEESRSKMLLKQNIVNIVVHYSLDINASMKVNSSVTMNDSINYVEMCNKCLELEAKIIKQHNMVEKDEYNRPLKSFSKLEQHCISLELAMQINKEIFEKNNTSVNQTEPLFDQLFELNNFNAELQAKDTTIEKLKANIKRLNKTSTTNSMKKERDDIETINIELEHMVTKLIAENEHLKQTYKQLYASIKPSREKVFVIIALKNDVRKFKGKDIVDNVAQVSNATTIAPGMYKLDPIVEQATSLNPLDSASYSTCKYVKLIQEFLGYVRDTCPDIHKPSEKLVVVTPINKKKTISSKSMSVKKAKKKEEWKPTGKVFTKIGYNWRPTGRTFTLVRNVCPLTRITATNKVPLREPILLEVVVQESVVTKVFTRRPKVVQIVLWYLDSRCSKHMTGDRSQLTNIVHKFLGTIKFGDDQISRILRISGNQPLYIVNWRYYDVLSNLYLVQRLKDQILMRHVRLNDPVRNIRTDNGTEFVNQTLRSYYESLGISYETSVTQSPQQNGVVEWRNCTLVKVPRTMLIYAKAPLFLWAEAVTTASKVDVGIFIGYAPKKKAYRIYNRRTQKIIKTIHVNFDELTAMASEQLGSGLGLQFMTPATSISGLVTNPIPQQPCNPPPRDYWDHLFQPMFDEYFNPPTIVVSPIPVANAPRVVDLAYSPVSTSINQDAPSISIPLTQDQEHSPIISQGFEESPKTPHFHYDPLHKSLHKDSASQGLSSNVRPIHTSFKSLGRWTKDHPIANVINTPMVEKNKLDEDLQGTPNDDTLYHGMIGSLIYLTSNRPDLIYAVCLSYADADHVGYLYTRRSTSGRTEFLGDKFVRQSSKKQKSTAISSIEAEYIALSGCSYLSRTMNPTADKQIALDNTLVAPEARLTIGNPCYPAFLITTEVPEIYMHQFWNSVNKVQGSSSYRFKIDNKKFKVNVEVFHDILQICLKPLDQPFDIPPFSDEEIVSFIYEIGYTRNIETLFELVVDHMHQPWRTFAAVINRCIFRKTTGLNKLRLSRAQILWGMYYFKNVDFVKLLWEDFAFQIDNHYSKESMPYPRFTKIIINHFISQNKSISMRNKINLHTVRDDSLLGTLKYVSKTEEHQVYGAAILKEMINEYILNFTPYKTYYAYASGAKEPKKARKFKKPASPKLKTVPVSPKEPTKKPVKKTVPAKKSFKSPAGVIIKDTPEAAQLKEAIKGSKKDLHISQASGSGDGTDFESGVPDDDDESWGDSEDDSKDESTDVNDDDNANDDDSGNEDDDGNDAHDSERTDSDDDDENPSFTLIDYDEEEHDEEYESNDDNENVYDEEDDDLYKDMDVRSLGAEHEKERKGDEEMTDANQNEESSTQAPSHPTVPMTPIPETSTIAATTIPPYTTINESIENVSLAKSSSQLQSTYEAATSLTEDLYDALVKSYQLDKDLFESYAKKYSLKRGCEYKDKDEDPSSGSEQGLKKRKTSKDDEPPKGSKSNESMSSSSKGTKSQLKSSGKSVQAEEPMFESVDTKMPQDQGGNTEDQPNVEENPMKPKRPKRPLTPIPDWNAKKSINSRPPQKWISIIAKAEKPPLTFDELMSTPIDFSAYFMHNLKIDNLTQEILVGPAFNLLKGTCKSFIELEYHFGECCQVVPADYFFNNDLEYLKGGSSSRKYTTSTTKTKAAKYDNIEGIEDMVPTLWSPVKVAYDKFAMWGISHWSPKRQKFYGYAINRESKHDVFSRKRIIAVTNVKVMKWYGYGYLEEIIVRKDDQKLYKFKEGDLPRHNLRAIEDLLLLLV